GHVRALALVPRTIADYHREIFAILQSLDIDVRIKPIPVEVPHTTPFPEDTTHRAYDADKVERFFRVLRRVEPILEVFRSRFRGKCTPVHFFWGGFDLAVTRFSGRRAPPREGATMIDRIAYDEEVISVGFWPGEAWAASDDVGAVDA